MEKESGRRLRYEEYPQNLCDRIEKSWEALFDLDRRDNVVGRRHKRNRSIQATFWILKQEYIVSAEILKREGDVIKTISSYEDSGHSFTDVAHNWYCT